jgi:hypothetical protein
VLYIINGLLWFTLMILVIYKRVIGQTCKKYINTHKEAFMYWGEVALDLTSLVIAIILYCLFLHSPFASEIFWDQGI